MTVIGSAPVVRRFPSMGTVVEVAAPPAVMERALLLIRTTFAQWDAELSRLRPDSELERLNRRRTARVSPLLWEVVRRALLWADVTDGQFDPCLGAQLRRWGFGGAVSGQDPGPDAPVDPMPLPEGVPGGAWRGVTLDAVPRTISLPPGAELDLGGIAKGMAVDAALHQLEEQRLTPVLVNAGGDLGVRGTPADPGYWSIGVGEAASTPPIRLRRGAAATSGIPRARWMAGERRLHRILDPRTGYPAETGLRQVTVVTGTVEQAEVLAKAAFLHGLLVGRRLIEREGAAARFEASDGSIAWAGPWPREDASARKP